MTTATRRLADGPLPFPPFENQHVAVTDRRFLFSGCGPIKISTLKVKPTIMSPLFMTADFYQYQIITLLQFQAGGRAAFFTDDAVGPLARRLM